MSGNIYEEMIIRDYIIRSVARIKVTKIARKKKFTTYASTARSSIRTGSRRLYEHAIRNNSFEITCQVDDIPSTRARNAVFIASWSVGQKKKKKSATFYENRVCALRCWTRVSTRKSWSFSAVNFERRRRLESCVVRSPCKSVVVVLVIHELYLPTSAYAIIIPIFVSPTWRAPCACTLPQAWAERFRTFDISVTVYRTGCYVRFSKAYYLFLSSLRLHQMKFTLARSLKSLARGSLL